MADRKTRKGRLVAVRLADADYRLLCSRRDEAKENMSVSAFLRDLIHNAANPVHEREILASIRKMQTDLSFCLRQIERSGDKDACAAVYPVLTAIRELLAGIAKKEGICGDHKAGAHEGE